ncbi:hypothetical protein [Streptomyces californicus]|uniref:hypothetical protein n=1 Tax=Streptomyces californicus TaxID=67351 RepID=UPI00379B497B
MDTWRERWRASGRDALLSRPQGRQTRAPGAARGRAGRHTARRPRPHHLRPGPFG